MVEEGEEKGEAVEQAAGERKVRETATPALANNINNNNNKNDDGSPRCIRYYRCFSWCAPLNVLSCAFCIVRARL